MDRAWLERLREKYADGSGGQVFDPEFRRVADRIFDRSGTRLAPFAGLQTFLSLPFRPVDPRDPNFGDLQVAVLGVPMDLGVTNRNGSRFGPRALRAIERIGPYNHVLGCAPGIDLRAADIGDVPLRAAVSACNNLTRTSRPTSLASSKPASPFPLRSVAIIRSPTPYCARLAAVGPWQWCTLTRIATPAVPSTGPDCHHGGPFRNAVLDGVLDPRRVVQIGIRGSAEYLWEFSRIRGSP